MMKKTPRLTVLAAALALSLFLGLSAAVPARAASFETLSAGPEAAIDLPGENHRHGHGGHQGRRGGGGCWY